MIITILLIFYSSKVSKTVLEEIKFTIFITSILFRVDMEQHPSEKNIDVHCLLFSIQWVEKIRKIRYFS